jgi:hypothetical protein
VYQKQFALDQALTGLAAIPFQAAGDTEFEYPRDRMGTPQEKKKGRRV